MSNKRYKIKTELEKFIITDDHPCIMAQTVIKQKKFDFDIYSKMESTLTAKQILENIESYIKRYNFKNDKYKTYIAVFPDEYFDSEQNFENSLWKMLSLVNQYDNEPWDPTVSNDPKDSNFSFSIKGKAFYIVGMHPKSSRNARSAPFPMIAFNLHWQFEQLREHGLYHKVRDHIRSRDLEKNGSVNPVLKDFGTSSEALQYSGKNNSEEWKCPFSN